MNTRRELHDLAALLRAPEPGSNNIGSYLGQHAERLAHVLRTSPDSLRSALSLTDDRVVSELRARIASLLGDQKAARAIQVSERSVRAACLLGRTARWTELGAVLDVDLLLSDVIADRKNKYVAFNADDGQACIAVRRDMLARVSPIGRDVTDLVVFVNSAGVHFRWKGGRAGYNWRPQVVPPTEDNRVLDVKLRLESDSRSSMAHLGDVLRDIGLRA